MEQLDKNECVYKLSSSVKTNRGVGKIAMTQKRLFLLTEGRPGYVEISTFRNIEVRAALEAAWAWEVQQPEQPTGLCQPWARHKPLMVCASVCSPVKWE